MIQVEIPEDEPVPGSKCVLSTCVDFYWVDCACGTKFSVGFSD